MYSSKEEALNALKEIEEKSKEIRGFIDSLENKEVEMEKLFLELLNQGLMYKYDPENKENKWYNSKGVVMIQGVESKIMYFSRYCFWSNFETITGSGIEIGLFLRHAVDKYMGFKEYKIHMLIV